MLDEEVILIDIFSPIREDFLNSFPLTADGENGLSCACRDGANPVKRAENRVAATWYPPCTVEAP